LRYHFNIPLILACVVFSSCTAQSNPWENLDYKSVYKRAQQREIDPLYQQPTTIGCMDEDLYNCSR